MPNEVFVTPGKDFSLTQIELDTLVQSNDGWERAAAMSRDYLTAQHHKDRAEFLSGLGKSLRRQFDKR